MREPIADASALHGLAPLVAGLPRLTVEPDSEDVRLDLQVGMWLSMTGPCIGVPLGASRGIGPRPNLGRTDASARRWN